MAEMGLTEQRRIHTETIAATITAALLVVEQSNGVTRAVALFRQVVQELNKQQD